MNAIQERTLPKPHAAYGGVYDDTRFMIKVLSGMTDAALADAAIELGVDYELFCADYNGPCLVDGYVGFAEMLRQWGPPPWLALDDSALNGLTVAQLFLTWAWDQNDEAKYCLDGEAVANEWKQELAVKCGVVAAVSAAKSMFYAKYLMATGGNKIAISAA